MDKLKLNATLNIIKGNWKQHFADLDEWKYAEEKEYEFIGKHQKRMRESIEGVYYVS